MNLNNKYLTAAIGAAVLLAIGAAAYKYSQSPEEKPQTQMQTGTETRLQSPGSSVPAAVQNSVWEGTLKASDNSEKGNLMLVMGERAVYINTSRDYSNLIGKEVRVTYEGTLESFLLGDISEK